MKKQGFSLVELLVSVMVISIIAVAFMPIITKRIQGNMAVLQKGNGGGEGDSTSVEPGNMLFVPSTEGCTSKDGYSECSFVVPKGVKRINVVTVGSGSGGSGGTKGEESLIRDEDIGYKSYSNGVSFSVDVTNPKAYRLDVDNFNAGGGGGGGSAGISDEKCYTGGGGAGGGTIKCGRYNDGGGFSFSARYSIYDNGKFSYVRLKNISGYAGRQGIGGATHIDDGRNGEDGTDGEETYMNVKYCFENPSEADPARTDSDGCFTNTYRAPGGKGGKGGKIDEAKWGPAGAIEFDPADYYGENAISYSGSLDLSWGVEIFEPFNSFVERRHTFKGCQFGARNGYESTWSTPNRGGFNTDKCTYSSDCVASGGIGSCCRDGYGAGWGAAGKVGFYLYINTFRVGAASASGTSGYLQHVESLSVTPGETCKVVVGKGGKGGDIGRQGQPGHDSYIKCSGFTLSSPYLYCTYGMPVGRPDREFHAELGYAYNCDPKNSFSSKTADYKCGYFESDTCKHVDATSAVNTNFYYLKTMTGQSSGYAYELTDGSSKGGSVVTATSTSATSCGGLDTASPCNNSSVDGQTYPFQTPQVVDVRNNNFYGYAGGGGGGGGYDAETDTAGKGGDGQDGYVLIYWGDKN